MSYLDDEVLVTAPNNDEIIVPAGQTIPPEDAMRLWHVSQGTLTLPSEPMSYEEAQRRVLSRSPLPNIEAGLSQAGLGFLSMGARATGIGNADAINRESNVLGQAADYVSAQDNIPDILQRGVRGVAATVPQMVTAGLAAGPYGAIGMAAASEMNNAVTEGRDRGLEGKKLAAYVATKGAVEGGIAAAFQMAGMGGAENAFKPVAKEAAKEVARAGAKRAIINFAKETGNELREEVATELSHLIADRAFINDEESQITPAKAFQTVADTTVQTLMTMGLMEGVGAGVNAIERGARQVDLNEARALRRERQAERSQRQKESSGGTNDVVIPETATDGGPADVAQPREEVISNVQEERMQGRPEGQVTQPETAAADVPPPLPPAATPTAIPVAEINGPTLTANVVQRQDGKYAVSFIDNESGESLPTVKIVDSEDQATKIAKDTVLEMPVAAGDGGIVSDPTEALPTAQAPLSDTLSQIAPTAPQDVVSQSGSPQTPQQPQASPESVTEPEKPKRRLGANAYSADKAEQFLIDTINRQGAGQTAGGIASWIRKGFGPEYYQKYLDKTGTTLERAIMDVREAERIRTQRLSEKSDQSTGAQDLTQNTEVGQDIPKSPDRHVSDSLSQTSQLGQFNPDSQVSDIELAMEAEISRRLGEKPSQPVENSPELPPNSPGTPAVPAQRKPRRKRLGEDAQRRKDARDAKLQERYAKEDAAKKQVHDYSNTMIVMPKEVANKVSSEVIKIDKADLADDGVETEPHVTVKYGLETDNPEGLRLILANEPPVRIKFGKTSVFPADKNRDSDVVKVDIESDDLRRLNKKIGTYSYVAKDASAYRDYNPHMTLAYVKAGLGSKYAGDNALSGQEVVLNELTFSDRQGNKIAIPLTGISETPIPPARDTNEIVDRPRDTKKKLGESDAGQKMVKYLQAKGHKAEIVYPETDAQIAAEKFARSAGITLRFVRTDAPVRGFGNPKSIAIRSNITDENALWGVLSHEIAHATGIDKLKGVFSDDLVKRMSDEYLGNADKFMPDYAAALRSDQDSLYREGVARTVQKFMEDYDFRQSLRQSDPGLWQWIVDNLKRLTGFTDGESEDMRRARQLIRNLVADGRVSAEAPTLSDKKSAAKQKRDEALQRLKDAFLESQSKLTMGVDPKLVKLAADLVLAEVELGVYSFAEFTQNVARDVPDLVAGLAPYLEAGWKAMKKRDDRMGEVGSVADVMDRSKLATHFTDQLASGKKYDSITQARSEASDVLGKKVEPGTTLAKTVDEAVEVGVVQAARGIVRSKSDRASTFDALVDLYDRQPRLGVRTSTSMIQQAYSTPAPLAYVASELAGVKRSDVAYDSSAGNGMLLIGSDNPIANELNPDRAASLRGQGIKTTNGDATEVTLDKPVSRIVINPPFGKVENKEWSIGGVRTDQVDHAITLKTLEQMTPDGKAAIIIGSKGFEKREPKADDKRGPAYLPGKAFYDYLYDHYNVTDHFTVHGDLYARQGAAFPVDVIIVDGQGKSQRPKPYNFLDGGLPEVYRSWEALRDAKLSDARLGTESVRSGSEPRGDQPASRGMADEASGTPAGDAGGESERGSVGGMERQVRPAGKRRLGQSGKGRDVRTDTGRSVSGEGTQGRTNPDRRVGSGVLPGPSVVDVPSQSEVGRLDEFQSHYTPGSKQESVDTLLPKNHVAAVTNALENIRETYGDIDAFVAKELGFTPQEMDALSAEQVDAVALAIARHKEGGAFIIGDQTGVGKGRSAAAMLVYAKQQGLIPVFVTEKPSLYADMIRDLTDINRNTDDKPFNVLPTNVLSGDGVIPLPDGRTLKQGSAKTKKLMQSLMSNPSLEQAGETYDAVFTTYDQMNPYKQQLTDRHHALKAIAPKAFFVLDESHNAGGGTQDDGRGSKQTLTRAEIIRDLVDSASGVYFSSATYAKRPEVMDLYSKTGMLAATNNDANRLTNAIASGGVPLQQVVSEMLVESGSYLRRERSFDGVEFAPKTVEVDLGNADKSSAVFRAIDRFDEVKEEAVKQMLKRINSSGGKRGKDSATGRRGIKSTEFSSIVWNLNSQMLLALKADVAANEAIESIQRGESPVIYVDSTLEQALNRQIDQFGYQPGDEIDFTFRDLLQRYLDRSREVLIQQDASDPHSYVQIRLSDEDIGPEGVALFSAAQDLIDNFDADMPASPIDWIRQRIEDAGYKVAEITGRKNVVSYAGGKVTLAKREESEQGTLGKSKTVSAFNSGEIDALIINRSGSTGISLHASEKFKNQNRRSMIIAQAALNIDTFMQSLGRIHRTGQVTERNGQNNLPRFTLLMTNAPAENRPASVLVKKLASLNANVTASSKGAVGFDVPDIINQVGDAVVMEYLSDNPEIDLMLQRVGMVGSNDNAPPDFAKSVTGRLALLPVEIQQKFWDDIVPEFDAYLEELTRLGKNPLQASVLDLAAKTIEKTQIFDGDAASANAFAQPAYIEKVTAKRPGESMTSQDVTAAVNSFYGVEKATRSDAMKWAKERSGEVQEAMQKDLDRRIKGREPEAVSRMQDEADERVQKIASALEMFAPGQVVEVAESEEGDSIPGVVIGVTNKNAPLVPSKWVFDIAIASSERKIKTPMSRLVRQDSSVKTSRQFLGDLSAFDEDRSAEETRYIGTGNLLAAYDQIRGQIAFFTDDTGTVRRGAVLPRSFRMDRYEAERPVVFSSAGKALQFLQGGGYLFTPDKILTATMVQDNLVLRAPAARSRSGKYTTNADILKAAGEEFVTRGGRIEMVVPDRASQSRVLASIINQASLQAEMDKDRARAILSNQESPAVETGGSNAIATLLSPELQQKKSLGASNRTVSSAADLVGDYEDDYSDAPGEFAFQDEESEKRFRVAQKGIGRRKMADKIKDLLEEFRKSTQRGSLPELDRSWGESRDALRKFRDAPAMGAYQAAEMLRRTIRVMSPQQFDLFARLVILRDLTQDENGLKPFGFTHETALSELARMEAFAAKQPEVQAAVEFRQQWHKAMTDDFINSHEDIGIDVSRSINRDEYYRHQVLLHYAADQADKATKGFGGRRKAQVNLRRGWLKRRMGSDLDINANYIEAEFEVAAQMMTDTIRAQQLARLKRYDVYETLRKTARDQNYINLLGGDDNYRKVTKLRQQRSEETDKEKRGRMTERIVAMDPTEPFRRDIAMRMAMADEAIPGLDKMTGKARFAMLSRVAKDKLHPGQRAALGALGAVRRRQNFIREQLGPNFLTWENVIPESHDIATIRPGRAMFMAYTLPEHIASDLIEEVVSQLPVTKDQLRRVMAMGGKYTPMVLPKPIVAQMASLSAERPTPGAWKKLYAAARGGWKGFSLLGPHRIIKYNLRNFSEIDKLGFAPGATSKIGQSAKELYKLFFQADERPSANLQAWIANGGVSAMSMINELDKVAAEPEFRRLVEGFSVDKPNVGSRAWRAYWEGAKHLTNFRESILRYAAFLHFKDQFEAGKSPRGASNPAEIRDIVDNDSKAGRLSADLFGAYDDVSTVGQFLRDHIFPFWSFQELNARAYWQGIKNLATDAPTATAAGKSIIKKLGMSTLYRSPYAAYRLGKVALLLTGAQMFMNVVNSFLMGDDDWDEIPEDVKNRPFLYLGRDKDGNVRYFDRLGTSTDVLDWFGLDHADEDYRDVMAGRKDLTSLAGEHAAQAGDKAYDMLAPWIKAPGELLTGQRRLFGKTRQIRDRGEYLAHTLGLDKEYRSLTGKPTRGYSKERFGSLVFYTAEKGQASYFDTLDTKSRWMRDSKGRGGGYASLDPKSLSLYHFKQAIHFGDQKSADAYLAKYKELGGTDKGVIQSLESLHPLSGLTVADEMAFMQSLDEDEAGRLDKAVQYYYDKLLTPDQAATIMEKRQNRLSNAVKEAATLTGRSESDPELQSRYDKDREQMLSYLRTHRGEPGIEEAIQNTLTSSSFQKLLQNKGAPRIRQTYPLDYEMDRKMKFQDRHLSAEAFAAEFGGD